MKVLEEAVSNSGKGKIDNDSDYEKDGLRYCGFCHTPKQALVQFPWGERKPRVNCRCEQERADKIALAEKEAKHREVVGDLLKECFPSRNMYHWRFDKDKGYCPDVVKYAQNYVENWKDFYTKGKGLLIYGEVGTGKTFGACCIANALIDNEIPCKFTDFSRIANELQDTWSKQAYLDGYDKYPLVIVDDLGIERNSDYMNEVVYNFIQHRYCSNLPLIVTSNLTQEELTKSQEVKNQRIYTRIFEMCVPIKLTSKGFRRQITANNYEEDMRKLRGEI